MTVQVNTNISDRSFDTNKSMAIRSAQSRRELLSEIGKRSGSNHLRVVKFE